MAVLFFNRQLQLSPALRLLIPMCGYRYQNVFLCNFGQHRALGTSRRGLSRAEVHYAGAVQPLSRLQYRGAAVQSIHVRA
jgi:hypothetical protein